MDSCSFPPPPRATRQAALSQVFIQIKKIGSPRNGRLSPIRDEKKSIDLRNFHPGGGIRDRASSDRCAEASILRDHQRWKNSSDSG
jgi:hypothetical protein